jgi:hypothetical protein
LTRLAIDLRQLRKYGKARELDEQALAMYRQLYDGDDFHIAMSLNNLATDIAEQGDQKRSRELREESLAMLRRLYDGDHPTWPAP